MNNKIWALVRIALGLIFLWAFFDKVFGLGYATKSAGAWLNGGSPTTGFLSHATGPFASFFQSLAGSPIIDWLFMLALLALGLGLTLDIGRKLYGWGGALLMLLMWAAALPVENHPFIDQHIIYALVFIGFATTKCGVDWGFDSFGKRFAQESSTEVN
jgi:thiosulfate dehydrogenase [quinone] large subunit